jgi:Holliday junction resolvase
MATVTKDEVWELFREVARRFEETDRRFKETDLKFKEIGRLIKELRESQKETDRQFKETDLKFKETDRQFKETDLKFQETDRQFKASDRKLQKLEDLFTSQWGRVMESLVEGDLVSILNQRGIAINDTTTRLKGRRADGGNFEFDILAHNGNEVVVIEVKTTLRPDDVKKFLRKLEKFKQWLPRYADNTIYGGMAWLTAVAGSEDMVQSRGLFSIRATGNSASVVNPLNFQPKAW